MNQDSSYDPLDVIRAYLLKHLGLNYTKKSDKDLIQKMNSAAISLGFKDYSFFAEWLQKNKLNDTQTGVMASHLTVGETYFMREKKGYDFLEQIYLPGIISKRIGKDKRIRIWCAGCATGEEAYSLAITLRQSIPNIKSWDIKLLATDINPVFLDKARRGIYTRWSFRTNQPEFINNYFVQLGENQFQVRPEIRNMVTFKSLNLATEVSPSDNSDSRGFDIIFCRNVFIYLSHESIHTITQGFYKALIRGGVMIVSPVEMTNIIFPGFEKIKYAGYTIYQKGPSTQEKRIVDRDERESIKNKAKKNQEEWNRLKTLLPEEKSVGKADQKMAENGYELAIEYFSQGEFKKCEEILSDSPATNGRGEKPELFLLAKTRANLGMLREADAMCSRLLSMDKLDPAIYYLNATIKQEQGEDRMAISLLKQALYLDGDFILANFLLGTLSLKVGESTLGKKSFKNALTGLKKLSPEDTVPESGGLTAGRIKEIIHSIEV